MGKKKHQDNPHGTQRLRIKAPQQNRERSLLCSYIKTGQLFCWLFFFFLNQFTQAEKPPLKSSLNLCLSVLLQDLNICSPERFVILLMQNGTLDFKTGCDMLVLPAYVFSPHWMQCFISAQPGKLQMPSRSMARAETQTGGGCSATLSTAPFAVWALLPLTMKGLLLPVCFFAKVRWIIYPEFW